VNFLVETRPQATRVPLESVRWVHSKAFVAVARSVEPEPGAAKDGPSISYRWQPVELGMSDTTHIEVVSGLKPGEKILAHPETLPPPQAHVPRPSVAAVDNPSRS